MFDYDDQQDRSISSLPTNASSSDGNTSFLRAARAGHLDKVLEHLKQNIDINTSNANGLNALHLASKDGHTEVVAELLKRGAAVDAATKKGNTALHIASLAGQEEVVKLLVNHGAKVNVQSQNGFTPLYMAAQENHDNVVRYLLSNGANQTLATEDGFTPLAVAMQQGHDKVVTVLLENDTRGKVRLPALHIAAKKDDVKAAKLLLENDHNPDVTSKSGFTPLHIASHYGNEAIAHLLIQKKADVNYAAKHNITPLHVAAKWGKTNMVALLLEKGATIESKTRDGLTPMHCAARSGHEQVVDMLLEREAPISCKTKNGLAPLHMAAQGDHVDAARILLYHRAPVDEVTVDYLTALHVAAHCGHVRVAKLLLDRQADSNARALNGFTPLHIACKKNRIKVVELLLKHGASISATTESGLTPLHVASFMGCMNIVIYLLQHDANPDVPTVRGETPLHLAARANQTDIIRILLRNGAQVDARAREQQTPLHIASRLGNVDIVMLLLQHGAKVDTTTKDMYTALHIAAKEGQDEVAGILIDNGASLNAITKKGFTPLHLAAKYGNIKVAKLLLQKDAPVDPQGKNGVTPLHVASHYDHQNVALLLLDKGASPHATAKNGHTPLHIAAKKNQMDIANTLLEYGAKPNAESKAGFTPLHLSAQEGHVDMSSLLIEHEADTNSQAKNGLTPLHLCAQEDRVAVADVLVKNKAIVDKTTKAGYTPLHVASHYGQNNMVKFLLAHNADVKSTTQLGYTPLHQAAQQGHTNVVTVLLENSAQPNAITHNGQTPLHIAQKLGYITVIDTLKVVTESPADDPTEEKYKVVAPEAMHETFMSDSEEEGGEDTMLGDNAYRYLTADEMKSLGDDSLPIDVTRDERMDSNKIMDSNMLPPQAIEDSISPHYYQQNYSEMKKYTPDNIDIARHPINIGFLVSFLVDARGGAMRGCRHSGVRVIVPPRSAGSPTRITCRYVRPQRSPHPPPLMEGEALASRVLELGPVGARFLGPVIIEVPHFAALRGKEREIVILRSDNGETWREHTVESSEDILNEVLQSSFEAEDISQLEDTASGRITRIVTHDFPQYFAVVSRIRQEVHAIGPDGGMVSSTVVPQVQAVFPQGALTKKIKVGLQAQPIDPELTAKLLGHGVAVSPVVTVEPRRRKFHKAITLSMPAPRAHSQGMINQYSGSTPTLRLLCSITGGTTRAQWEDVTGSTPLTFVNDCVSFTTTVSARFWLMDCRNVGDATKMATELYREAIHVPFMAKFVVFAKRVDPLEARLRVFCMTDDKEDKTLEHQEHFSEVAKSRDVEVLEGKPQYIEFAGNLVPITKSGEQLQFAFRAFRENRLPFSVRVKDQHAEALGRCLFMREPKVAKGEPPQQPVCILNIVLPDDIVADTISLTDSEHFKRHEFLKDSYEYHRPDPRLADMSNLLGDDWVALAGQLGLTSSEINVIKSEYPESVAKQAQSMLRMWISQSSNRAQSSVLEDALRKIGRDDIIPQCLNVEETVVKYRIRSDLEDKDIMKDSESIESIVIKDKKRLSYDKYSAEEKVVEEKSDEEDFSKTVKEKREIIEKRLSVDRTIPASSQRVEIVQEISSIKRQSMVEDKIAEVEQKATMQPPSESKSTTEEVKTTKSSVADATKDERDAGVTATTTTTTTTVTETRTIEVTGSTHIKDNDSKESVLVEGVTHGLEKKTAIPKIVSAQEDPQSPKLSKTPPPSPADFILREQMAALQEWDEPKEKALATELQGKQTTTSTTQNFEDRRTLDDKELASKQLVDKTNAFNEVDTQLDASVAEIKENGEELKQKKPGFFGALKTMVTRSFDYSDSESEKSQSKKEKKDKKKKKKRGKDKDDKPESPVKVQPLTIEEERLKTIPYAEASPVLEQKAFIVAENIVTEVKKVPAEVVAKEEKLVEKKTIVPVVELIEELETKIYDTPEFHIEVKPLTPTKEKVIYDVDIHSTIDSIGKELLKDDTITDKPPRISETDVYDDQAPQLSIPPDHVSHLIEEPDNDALKMITFNLIQNEMSFQGWADDKHNIINITKSQQPAPASQKMKRKHGKLFGFLSKKSSKEVEDSDDDTRTDQSRSEIIEKQDKESSKEIVDDSSTSEQNKKGGFFTIFGKKNKKEDDAIPESSEVDEDKTKTDSRPPKILISEPTRLDINNSDSFIKQEVTHYEDVRPVIPADKTQVTAVPEEESKTDRKSGIFSGIFGKKKDDIDTEKDEKAKTPTPDEVVEKITEKVDKTVEVTKKELHDVKETITETTLVEKIDKPIDASEKRKGGVYTDIFIKNEIQSESQNITQHEKVTVTTETVTKTIEENGKHEFAEEAEKDDQGEKKKSGIFSGIFSKKDKRDSDEPKVKSPIFGKKDTKPEAPKEDKKDQEDGKETVKEVIQTTEVVMRRSKQKDAQADEKPDQKEEEKEKRRSGIFSGIFGKKDKGKDSEDEKTDDEDVSTKTKKSTPIFGKKEKTPPAKIILSNELVTTMKDTESFLQEEVSRYEDVKPLVKPIAESEVADTKPAAQQEEEKEKRKSGIFSGIFGKKEKPKEGEEEKPDEQDSPAKPKMTLRDKHLPMNADVPDEVLERLKNANLISKKEVPVFEDSNGGVRHEDEVDDSAVKAETETLPEIIADVSEKDKRKAGIFSGIFGKKDKATENEEEKDVKSPTKQKKMTPIFGKKDKSKPTEIKLSEEVVTTMITTESFLQEEVARFEDVMPLPKKEREPEVVDEKSVKSPETEAKRKSGLFSGIFSKRDKSRDKEDVKSDEDDVAVDKQKDTPVEIVSDEVEKIVQEVKSTVEQIEVHVDEKPFDVQPETQPDDKEKRRSGIFSGIFGKKDKGKESEDEKTDDEETVSKTKKHTPIFGKKDKKTTTTAVISDDVVNSMKTTEAFLQEEVARFEDVKPVVTATTELEVVDKSKEEAKEVQPDEEKEKRKSGIFSGIFGKKDKGKESEDEKTDDEEAVSKQKKQTPIFGKKEKKTPEKTQLSEEAKQVIKDSDAFLQEEVSRYDDVKPVITEKIEIVEEVEEKPKEKSDEDKEKRKSGIFSGLFGKKDKGKESEDEKTDDEEITTKTKKQTSIFTKKEKKPPTKVELPEDVVKDMKETDNFLQEEVARYEDVKLIKSEEPEIEKEEIKIEVKPETDADNEKDKRKSGLFSGIFGKKDKSSKESEDEKTDDEETITKTKKRSPIFGKKEMKTPTKIELSENVVKDMKTTDSFLQEEVKNYEDVKPLPVKQLESETIEVKVETTESVKTVVAEATEKVDLMKTKQDVQSDEEKEKRKSGIFSGLFGKKDKGKESEDEKTDDEEVTSKAKKHTPIFGKKDKKTPTAVVISEDVLTSMKTTESFLKEEVERFEDVKPVIAEITEPAIEIKTKQDDKPDDDKEKRKSGIFSGIFGKKDKGKESEDEKTDDEETISKSKKRTPIFGKKDKKTPTAVVISEDVLTSMKMTETFLQEEVDRFEDVKPVIAEITETAPEPKTKQDDKPEDDKEKRKSGIFSGIFGKKDKGKESEDEKTDDEEAVSKQKKQTPIFGKKEKKTPTKVDLSEDTIIKMKATDSFLVKEVDVYEDVRPVITEKIEITESVTLKSPTYVSGDKDKTKSGIFSGIFVKKDKGSKESEDEKTDDESTPKSKKSKLFGKKEDKAPTKVVLSEEIKRTLKETDTFLQDEVANYEDVKPVVQPIETVDVKVTSPTPIEDDKEIKRKSGLFGGIFGIKEKSKDQEEEKSDSEDTVGKVKKSTPLFSKKEKKPPVDVELSKEVIESMETTKSFLTEEVNRFDDVKPIIKPAEDNVATLQALAEEEKEKRKSGIFSGIFKKEDGKESEDEKTDNEDEQTKAKRKPIFGKKAKASPTKEIKPVDHEKTEVITSPAEETKDKKAKSGIFSGMFTKKDKATEDSKLIEYDEEVKTTLKNTSDFINVEIEKYHDVKATTEPTKGEKDEPKEESTEKAQKSKTGIFGGLFSPKDKKEDDLEKVSKKEIQPTETDKPVNDPKQTEDVEKGVLEEKSDKKKPGIFQGLFTKKEKEDEPREPISEDVLKAMKSTDEFLAKEVEVHEDVRLLVPVTLPDAEIPETDSKKEKAKSGIFSGIFGQKDKKESTDVEKVKAQTPIFGKMGLEETEAKKDVAPLIPMPEGDKTTTVVETTDLDETTTEIKQKSGILSKIKSPIFGKSKKSEPIQLTEKTIQEMKETDNFIKTEVEVFEDVRLVKIGKEKSDVVTEQDQEEDKVPKKKSGLLSGIFSKKDKKSIDEPTEAVEEDIKKKAQTPLLEKKTDALPVVETTVIDIKTTDDFLKKEVELHEDVCISTTLIAKPLKEEQIEEKRKSGLFSGLLGKKDKKESTEETIPSVETSKEMKPAIALSEEAALGINATNDFLQKEVEVHEDVRPAIVTAVVTSTTVLSDDEDKIEKRKSGIFSGLFGKKEKKEISIETDLPKEKVEIMESVEIETVSVPNAEVPEGVVIHTNEERNEKTKSGIFDSIFGKKEKLPESEVEKIKEPKKIRTPIFGVKDKKDKASKDISEEVLKSMNDTDKFLQDEITKYEDVKLVVEMQPPTEEKADKPKDMDVTSPSKSKKVKKGKRDSSESGDESDASSKKSKFGLFSRKPKTTKSDPIKEAPSKEDKIALSDECIEDMNQTDSFLKTEVLNHEDVMLKSLHESKIDSEDKETTEIKETKHKVKKHKKKPKRDSSESGEESDTAARTKKFRIFGKSKKRAESAPITEASSKEDKLGLSAEIIKTMNETSDFLTTEVKNYEDVKLFSEDAPKIIQEPPVKVDKKKKKPKRDSSESGEESDTGHKSRRFNIFGKKKAKTTSMEIPIQEASSREDNLDKIEIPEDNADIIEEIITKTTVVVKDDSFGNKLDDTKEFLATEIENFEDVKPIVIAEVVQDTEETKKKRGFGLFGRKGKGVKSDSEDESTEVKESKGIFKIFSKKSKKDESDDEKEKHVTISKVVEEIPDATVADEVLVVTASVLESPSLATKTDSDAEKLTETKTTSAEKEDDEKEPATMKVIEEMTVTRTTTDLNLPDVKARDGSTEDKKIKVVTEEVALHKEVIKDSVDTYELTLDQIKNGADEDLKRLIAQQDSQNIVTSEFDADVQRVVDDLGTTIVTTTTRDRVEELNGGLLEGTFTTVETQCVVTTKQVTEVTETLVSDKNKNVTAEIKDGIEVGPSEIVEIEPTPIELVDKMNDAIKDAEAIAAAARAATAAKASQLKLDLTNKKTPAIPKKTSKSGVTDTTKKTTGAPKVAAKSSSSSSSSSTAAVTKSKLPKDREVKPAPVTKGTKAKETKKEDTKKVMESTKGAVKGALKATKAALTPKTKDKAATASTETKKETSPTKPTKTGVATKGTKVFGVKGTGKGALQKTPSVTKIAQDIKTGIKDTKDKATSKAKETALKVEEDVKTEVEIVESKVTTASNEVEDKVKESISDVKVAVHDIKVEIENKVDEIKAEIPKVQSEVDLKIKEIDEDKTKLADDLDKTAEQLQGTKDVISESIKDASAEVSDAVEIQTKQLTDNVKDATDVIDAKLDEIKDKSEQIIPALVETCSSIEKTAKDTKKGFLGKLSEKISGKSSQEEVEIKITDVKQTKDKPKKGILGKISDKFSSSKDKVEESITDVVQEVKEEASDVKKIVTTEIEEDVDKAKHLITDGTEKTVDLAEKTVDAADKMITAISDDVQTKQKDLTSDFIAQEKEANKHQQSVMDHAKDVSDGVLQKVDTEKAKIEELSAEVQAKGDKTISEVTTTVKEELVHDVQAVGEALEDIKSSAKEEKKGFLGKLSDKISSIGSKEEKVEKKSKGGIFGKLGSKDKEREKSEPKESDDITTKIAAVKDSFTNGVGSVSTSVKQTVEQKAADLSQTIDDKKQELKESTDEAVIVIDEKVSKAKDKTLDELQKLEDSVSSKVQETQKDAEETVIGLQESLEAVKTEVKEQKDATLDAVKDLKDDAEKSLRSTKAEVKETIIATEQKVSDKVDEIKKDIEKSIEKDTQKIIDAKGSVKEDVSKVSSDIQKKTTEQLASIKDGVEETLDKTKVAAETASKEIKEESKGFFDKLSSKLSKKSSDDESSKDKDEPKKKKGIFGKLTKADTKDKDDKEKGKNVSFSGVTESISDKIQDVIEKTDEGKEQLKSDISDAQSTVQKKSEEVVDDVKDSVKELEIGLSDAVKEAESKKVQVIDTGKEISKDIKDSAETTVTVAAEKLSEIKDTVTTTVQEKEEKLKQDIQEEKDALVKSVTATTSDIKPKASDAAAKLDDSMDKTKADVYESVDKVKEAADKLITDLKDEPKGFFDKLSSKLSRKPSDGDSDKEPKKKKGIFGKLSKKDSKDKEELDYTPKTRPTSNIGVTQLVSENIQEVVKQTKETKEILKEQAEKLSDDAKTTIDATVEKVENVEESLSEKVKEEIIKTESQVEDVTTTVDSKIEEIKRETDKLTEVASEIKTDTETKISETKESLQSEMDSIKKETKEQITIVEDTADKIVSENVEKAKASAIEITTDVKEETKGIKEEAKGFFDKLGSKLGIKSDVDSTTDSEKEPKKKKGIFGKSSKSKDQDDIKDTTESSLLGKVPQVISEKVQEVVEHTQETKTKLEEKSETVIDAVKTEIEKTEKGAESIKKTIEHTEENLSDTIKEKALLTEATISEVVKQADATVQKLTSEVQDIKETSKSKLDSCVSDIKETVQKKLDDGKETTELIKQELVNIKDSAEHTTSEIKEETSKQITVIEDVATKTKDDIIQTTDKVKESAETSITNVKDEAKGFFDKFSSKLSKKSAESESAKETEKEPKKKKGIFGKLGRKDSKEKEETKESVKITSGIVGDLPEVITQKVTEIVDKTEETKEQVKDKGTSVLTEAKQSITESIDDKITKTETAIDSIKTESQKISEEVLESSKLEVEKKASEINGTVTSTIENIEDKISSAKQEVVDTKVSIEKSLDDTAADTEKKVSEKTSDIVHSIETTVSETKEEAKGFFDKLSNKLTKKSSEEESTKPSDKEPKKKKGIFGKLTKRSSKDKGDEEEILTETVSAGVSASQNIVDQVKSEATNTIEAAEQLKEDALHAVDKSTTLIKDTTHSVQSQIETKVNDIKMAETEFSKKMSESISNVEASVSDAAQQIDTMAKDTVKSTVEVKDDLKEESKNVIDSIATTTSDIKDTVKEDMEKSKEATNVAIQKAIDTKDSVSHTITETASDIKQETVQQLADTKDSTKADIAQAADKIQESVSGGVTEAKEETKGFFDKISNKLTRKSSDGDSAKDSEKDSKKKKGIFGKLGKKDSKGKDDELTKDTNTELKEQIVLGVQKTAQKIESDIVQTSAFLQSESASALESASKSIDTTVDKGKGTVEVTEKLITEKVQQVEEGAKVIVDDITKTVKDEKKGFFEKINDKLSGKSDQETSKDDEKADKKKRGLLGKFTKRRSTEQEEEKEETKEAGESKKVDDDDNKTKKGFIEKLTDRFSAKSLDEVVVADQIKEVVDETIPDTSTESTEVKPAKRTPLFRIESEEDSAEVNLQRRASIKSNILENLTEQNLEALVTDLDLNRSELQSDYFTEKLENKLDDLEKIVDDLERRESITDKEEKIDGKLKRVERKFERMASDTIEKEIQEAKKSNITTPEFEEKRESEFQKVVSQLSTEEVSEFQTDYATLWDEQTFSHTDEWGSKTPESQADVTELPQGESSVTWQESTVTTTTTTTSSQKAEDDEKKADGASGTSNVVTTTTTTRTVTDPQHLSEEMKQLLKEMEEQGKK